MSDTNIYAGIDIGGTSVKYGLFKQNGEIIYKDQQPTMADKGPQPLMHLITNIGERLLLYAAEDNLEIKHIGIGSPGAVDYKIGKVIGPCPNIDGWEGMEIGANLTERLNLPVYVDNDVHAMALGEYFYGAARNCHSVVCATIGTGIGGAVLLKGKLHHGFTSSAGELGHMTIKYDGNQCACGNYGCLEAYCSSKSILDHAKYLLQNKITPIFDDILKGELDKLTIKKLFNAAKQEDPIAIEVITQAAEHLGVGLSGIVNLLNPEIVVIGGGITEGGAGFIEKVTETIKKYAFHSATESIRIEKAMLGNDAGFIGAGLLGEYH